MRNRTKLIFPNNDNDVNFKYNKQTFGKTNCKYAFNLLIIVLFFSISSKLCWYISYSDQNTHELDQYRTVINRIRQHIVEMSKKGPRTPGSASLFHSEQYIIQKLKEKLNFKNYYLLNLEQTRSSGSFLLDMVKNNLYISYSDISNIIFRINSKKHENVHDYCLLNCHYDSVYSSPGVSDNLINCAILLELIDHLVMKVEPTRWNCHIILIFNGGEESLMTASHSYVSSNASLFNQMRKSGSKFYVVNLDAAGSGGKAILFQTTKSAKWMVNLYADSVAYPFSSSLSQEIFDWKLIPSDTDFRIFRDLGKFEGVDLAFIGNGHNYHTPLDNIDNLADNDIFLAYSNLKSYALALFTNDLSKYDKTYADNLLYSDYLGLFMFTFKYQTIQILSTILSLFIFFHIFITKFRLDKKCLAVALINSICLFIIPLVINMVLSQIFRIFNAHMFWFTYKSLIKVVYFTNYVFVSLSIQSFTIKHYFKSNIQPTLSKFYSLIQLHICFLTFILALFKSNLIIFLMISQIFNFLLFKYFNFLNQNLRLSKSNTFLNSSLFLGLILMLALPLFIFFIYNIDLFISFIVPIMGRIGKTPVSELVVSIIASFSSFLILSFMALILKIFIKRKILGYLLFISIAIIILIKIPIYSQSSLKRFIVQHVQITPKNQPTFDGLLLVSYDNRCMDNLEFDKPLKSLKFSNFETDFLPIHYSSKFYLDFKMLEHSDTSQKLPLSILQKNFSINLLKHTFIDTSTMEYHFEASGSNVLNVQILLIKPDVQIIDWSLSDGSSSKIEPNGYNLRNKPVYFASWVHGEYNTTKNWLFSLKIKSPSPMDRKNYVPQLTIALTGHYEDQTSLAINFASKWLPDFSNPVIWSSKLLYTDF